LRYSKQLIAWCIISERLFAMRQLLPISGRLFVMRQLLALENCHYLVLEFEADDYYEHTEVDQ